MYKSIVILLTMSLLAGTGHADSLSYTSYPALGFGVVTPTQNYLGNNGTTQTKTIGQTFKFENDVNLSSMEFRLTGVPPWLGSLSYHAYIVELVDPSTVIFETSSAQNAPAGFGFQPYFVDTAGAALTGGEEYVALITTLGAPSGAGEAEVGGIRNRGFDPSPEGHAVVSSAQSVAEFQTVGFQDVANIDFALLLEGDEVAGGPDPDPDPDPDPGPGPSGGVPEPFSYTMWAVFGFTGLICRWRRGRRRSV